MLYERSAALATTGISLAILIPETSRLWNQPNQSPGFVLIPGAVIGAVGIFMGSAVAGSYSKQLGRTLRFTAWGFLGLGIGVSTICFGLRAFEWWKKLIFFGTGCLPLFAWAAAFFRNSRSLVKTGTPPP